MTAEWSDQEIADLIISWRVTHKQDPAKALRRAYVQKTIGKAKSDRVASVAAESLGRMDLASSTKTTASRERVLQTLREALSVAIARWIQHGTENARYTLVLDDGREILIGTAADVTSQRRFRVAIYEAAGILSKQMKAGVWDRVCMALAAIVEVIDSEEGTRRAQVETWIDEYLERNTVVDVEAGTEEFMAALVQYHPFTKDRHVHIAALSLLRHINFSACEKIGRYELYDMLRNAGWASKTIGVRVGEKNVSRYLWRKQAIARNTSPTQKISRELEGEPSAGEVHCA